MKILKLTIITVHLNNFDGFLKTYNSIQKLNINGFEFKWIIKDGVSEKDVNDKITDKLEKLDNVNWYLITLSDKGIYDAMNSALKNLSDNELVLFLNCGDELSFTFLNSFVVEDFEGYDFIYSDTLLLNGNKRIAPLQIDFSFLLSKTINHQSFFIKSNILKKYPFKLDYNIVADWVQLFEIFKNEKLKTKKLDYPISIYEGGGISELNDDMRLSQRLIYLRLLYSDWELDSLLILAKLRQRSWFDFIKLTLDSPKRSKLVAILSHIFSR
jgi:hypothetical protein